MTENAIFFSIYGSLLAIVLLYILPVSIFDFRKLLEAHKNGKRIDEPETAGVATSHINFTDVFIALLFFFIFKPPSTPVEATEISTSVLGITLVSQVFFIGMIATVWGFRVNLVQAFGLKLMQPRFLKWSAIVILSAWGLTYLSQLTGYLSFLESYYGKPTLQPVVLALQNSTDPSILALITLTACIGAPFAEEVIFRGFLFPVIKKYSNLPLALFVSGLLFALIHYNLGSLLILFVMGVLLALAYERTRCLWVPIITHIIFNSITIAAQLSMRVVDIPVPQQ